MSNNRPYFLSVRKINNEPWPEPGPCWTERLISLRFAHDLNNGTKVSIRHYSREFGVHQDTVSRLLKKEGLAIEKPGKSKFGNLIDASGWRTGQPLSSRQNKSGQSAGSQRAIDGQSAGGSGIVTDSKANDLGKTNDAKAGSQRAIDGQSAGGKRAPYQIPTNNLLKEEKKKTKGKKENELVDLFREIYMAMDGARWKWSDRLFQACAAKLSKSPQVLARKQWDRFLEATRYYIGLVESGAVDPRYQIRPDYWIHKQRRKEDPKPSNTWTDERYQPPAKQCGKCAGSGKVVRVVDEKRVAVDCECGGAA